MAYDKFDTVYCLTENGWMLMEEANPNVVVIEKWLQETYQGSGFGKQSKHGHFISANPDFNQEHRKALHAKFPAPWSEEEQWRRNQQFSKS